MGAASSSRCQRWRESAASHRGSSRCQRALRTAAAACAVYPQPRCLSSSIVSSTYAAWLSAPSWSPSRAPSTRACWNAVKSTGGLNTKVTCVRQADLERPQGAHTGTTRRLRP